MSKADIAAFADKKWILSHLEILNKMYQISTGFQSYNRLRHSDHCEESQ